MKIAVFGATGRSGVEIVRKARDAGHDVVAFGRNAERLAELDRLGAAIVQGEAGNRSKVAEAVAGVDAVVSAIGPTNNSKGGVMAIAADTIITTMKEAGVSRLLWMTGAGVKLSDDEPSLSRSIIRGIMKMISGNVLADSEAGVQRVVASGLEWTVVRAPMLGDGPATGSIKASLHAPKAKPVPRADIAVFMVGELERREWVGKAPMVSAV